jgi:hypothetical protein
MKRKMEGIPGMPPVNQALVFAPYRVATEPLVLKCLQRALGECKRLRGRWMEAVSAPSRLEEAFGHGFAECIRQMTGQPTLAVWTYNSIVGAEAPRFGPTPYPVEVRVRMTLVDDRHTPLTVYVSHGHRFFIQLHHPDGYPMPVKELDHWRDDGDIPLFLRISTAGDVMDFLYS